MTEETRPAELFFDADVRVEQLIYIPGLAACDEAYPDVFEDEFVGWLPEETASPIYDQLPVLKRFADEEEELEAWQVGEALRFTRGFLVQAATPGRHYRAEDVFSSGWGNYWTAWLYAPDEASIARVCAEWAETMHAKDLQKWRDREPAQ